MSTQADHFSAKLTLQGPPAISTSRCEDAERKEKEDAQEHAASARTACDGIRGVMVMHASEGVVRVVVRVAGCSASSSRALHGVDEQHGTVRHRLETGGVCEHGEGRGRSRIRRGQPMREHDVQQAPDDHSIKGALQGGRELRTHNRGSGEAGQRQRAERSEDGPGSAHRICAHGDAQADGEPMGDDGYGDA